MIAHSARPCPNFGDADATESINSKPLPFLERDGCTSRRHCPAYYLQHTRSNTSAGSRALNNMPRPKDYDVADITASNFTRGAVRAGHQSITSVNLDGQPTKFRAHHQKRTRKPHRTKDGTAAAAYRKRQLSNYGGVAVSLVQLRPETISSMYASGSQYNAASRLSSSC